MTTLALGIAGAFVGGALGGPLGASIGWSIGAMAGSYFTPGPSVQGPRLTDLKLQGSSYGAFEPRVYGTVRLAGNVIWQTDLEEHSTTTSSGGKGGGGGGTVTTTYSYTASFDVLICESPVDTLRKIWADGRLIYDSSLGLGSDLPFVFYDGNEAQAVDPTEEADTGVGLTPAYRGVVRVVFTDFDLTPYGNRIPQLEFLVATAGASSGAITLVKENLDTRWPQHSIITSWETELSADTPLSNPVTTDAPDLIYLNVSPFPHIATMDGLVLGDGTSISLWGWHGTVTNDPILNPVISSALPNSTAGFFGGINFAYQVGIPVGTEIIGATTTRDHRTLFVWAKNPSDEWIWFKIKGDNAATVAVVDQGTIDTVSVSAYIDSIGWGNFMVDSFGGGFVSPLFDGVSMAEMNEEWIWQYSCFTGILPADPPYNTVPAAAKSIFVYHIDPVSKVMTRNAAAGIAGPIPSGGIYSSLYSMADGYCATIGWNEGGGNPEYFATQLWTRFADTDATVLLADVVADICDRAGLSAGQINVLPLTDRVDGYIVSQQMPARNAIEALMPIYGFDAVESDAVLKFIKRGGESAVTIPDDDLAAHDDGNALPPLVVRSRKQDVDLPAMITNTYYNKGADYQLGSQPARRMVTNSELTTTINTPVVLTDDHAKQIAEWWLYSAQVERDEYEFYTTRKYVKYEPTDVATVQGIVLRLTDKTESTTGVVKWNAVPSSGAILAQAAAGGAASGFVPPTAPGAGDQQTQLVMLDIPLITNDATQAVYRPAMAGMDRPIWAGAELLKSTDGGTNYSSVISSTRPDTIGAAAGVLGWFGGGNMFDESNTVSVVIRPGGGDLASATEDDVLNGANEAVLGMEIIQYKTATLTAAKTYTLSGLLRGRRGTEWAMGRHVVGERFVVLPTVNAVPSLPGDRAIQRTYKAVTAGRALASAAEVLFTDNNVSLLPYSPVHLGTGTNASGEFLLQWTRRARVNHGWQPYVDVPLDEADELYQVTFWTDATYTVIAGITTDIPQASLTVTTAMQTALFGSTQANLYWSVAQIGAIGPGFDSLGRAPVVSEGPPAPEPYVPGQPSNVPPIGVQWHSDFRFVTSESPYTNAMKNADWLMGGFGSSWSFAYVVASRVGMSSALQSAFNTQYGDPVEATRIINTFAGAGYYAPAGVMVPWSPAVLPQGSGPPALSGFVNQVQTIIPLPYPDNTDT